MFDFFLFFLFLFFYKYKKKLTTFLRGLFSFLFSVRALFLFFSDLKCDQDVGRERKGEKESKREREHSSKKNNASSSPPVLFVSPARFSQSPLSALPLLPPPRLLHQNRECASARVAATTAPHSPQRTLAPSARAAASSESRAGTAAAAAAAG